jgi:hypothetical protein
MRVSLFLIFLIYYDNTWDFFRALAADSHPERPNSGALALHYAGTYLIYYFLLTK